MRLVTSELVVSREILPGQWLQSFHAPELASSARAGQFLHVRTGDYSGLVLRRPFSINTADVATGVVTIHFRTIGRGTEWFTRLRPGDTIDVLGPLGRPFEVDPRSHHLLLVAGGLGMAGVRFLADQAIRDGRQVTLLFGAAGARERGYNASARIAQANESVARTIDEIAKEIDAGLVVCGQRGRGAIRSALLGSVSHALAAHTKRPVLIAPQHPS